MAEKPRVAFYWCASCGGCEETVVDLAEAVLDVVAAVDIVFWPVALDFKRKDVAAMPEGSILATFINGAIRSTEQEEMAHLLRSKSKLLLAFGSCSHLGGIPGLANLFDRESILQDVYRDSASTVNPAGVLPVRHHKDNGHSVELPGLYETVRTLGQVVDVDYYIPGCPPTPRILRTALQTLLGGESPAKGAVLAPDSALCEECPAQGQQARQLIPGCIQAPSSGADRRGEMSAGARPAVHGPSDSRWLRSPMHPGKYALHRLLRPDQPGEGPRRESSFLSRFAGGKQGRGRNRCGSGYHP